MPKIQWTDLPVPLRDHLFELAASETPIGRLAFPGGVRWFLVVWWARNVGQLVRFFRAEVVGELLATEAAGEALLDLG
jgi:hypothetical protein